MTPPFALIDSLIARSGAAALVSVLVAKGSTPREAGARMVVSRDGAISGTIGGGRLEQESIDRAVALMLDPADRFEKLAFALGPSLGQCCGGHVTIGIDIFTSNRRDEVGALATAERAGSFETVATVIAGQPLSRDIIGPGQGAARAVLDPDGRLNEQFGRRPRRLTLFGAGHVGRALVLALAPLPFEVIWVDIRPDMFPDAVPRNVRVVPHDTPSAVAAAAPADSFVAVMTHDHGLDLEIIHAALQGTRPAYVGLIGSATKRARFESRLLSLGLPQERARDFRCPVGITGLTSKEPAIIAASVAAELLLEDQRLGFGLPAVSADATR